jgi:CxxC motif-containing protein (DUF1111 family)
MFGHRLALTSVLLAACGGGPGSIVEPEPDAGPPRSVTNASDVPIDGLPHAEVVAFQDGDDLFGLPFRAVDGLGPLFIRTSCGACHEEGARGPGLVEKLALVEADGVTPLADQSALAYGHTVREGLAAGATTGIIAPPGAPPDAPAGAMVKVTLRLGPAVLGRGYLEAVDDAEILRVEAEQAARTDGIHGVAARTTFASVPNPDTSFSAYHEGDPVIGRFGLKARIATIDDFTADAYQGDMGMTTPMRPVELANPDGLLDDQRPGVDLDLAHVDRVAFYIRRIAIPRRVGLTAQGAALFEQTACAACHVPTLKTRASYPIAKLAGIDAPIYTDLLLHDMGAALADGMTDGGATSQQWRTAPLIGLRFARNYLHDGRAHSVAEAVAAHDGEAHGAAVAFQALAPDDQHTLIQFIEAL